MILRNVHNVDSPYAWDTVSKQNHTERISWGYTEYRFVCTAERTLQISNITPSEKTDVEGYICSCSDV